MANIDGQLRKHSLTLRHVWSTTMLLIVTLTNKIALLGRYFVFYSGTMPLLSFLHAVVDLTLYLMARLQPLYALMGAIVFVCGWGVQVGYWAQCDLLDHLHISGVGCYQSSIMTDSHGALAGVPTELANAKVAFGFIVWFS